MPSLPRFAAVAFAIAGLVRCECSFALADGYYDTTWLGTGRTTFHGDEISTDPILAPGSSSYVDHLLYTVGRFDLLHRGPVQWERHRRHEFRHQWPRAWCLRSARYEESGLALTFDGSGHPLIAGYSKGGLSGLSRLTYDLIFTNDLETVSRGCLPPNCS
jgi:hypothetical protein